MWLDVGVFIWNLPPVMLSLLSAILPSDGDPRGRGVQGPSTILEIAQSGPVLAIDNSSARRLGPCGHRPNLRGVTYCHILVLLEVLPLGPSLPLMNKWSSQPNRVMGAVVSTAGY